MTNQEMKELYDSGDWICISIDYVWNKWIISDDPQWYENVGITYKLIHKKHSEVLDNWLDGGKVEYFTNYHDENIWSTCERFIEIYKPDLEYRIIEDKPKKSFIDKKQDRIFKQLNTMAEEEPEKFSELVNSIARKISPSPKRITREEAHWQLDVIQNGSSEYKDNRRLGKHKYLDKVFDYIERLEANQKEIEA